MDLDQCIEKLSNQADIISDLIEGISGDQARRKPDPDSWSILEVINHLYDEEREDFRAHMDYILHRPDHSWPLIDPMGWVSDRKYNQRDLGESLRNFLEERKKSLAWLRSLPQLDWNSDCQAPFGRITAGDMMASWVAHDLLHIRQLVELHWFLNLTQIKPFRVEYAGEW